MSSETMPPNLVLPPPPPTIVKYLSPIDTEDLLPDLLFRPTPSSPSSSTGDGTIPSPALRARPFISSAVSSGLLHMYGFHHELALEFFSSALSSSSALLSSLRKLESSFPCPSFSSSPPCNGDSSSLKSALASAISACYVTRAFLHLAVAHCHCPNYNFYGDAYYCFAGRDGAKFPR